MMNAEHIMNASQTSVTFILISLPKCQQVT